VKSVSQPLRVVHVSPYFAPAYRYGGPPRSLLSLCRAQRQAGLDVEVFTTTADGGDGLPAAPDGVLVDGVRVRYFALSPPRRAFGAASMRAPLGDAACAADVVHLHGLFNRTVWMGSAAARLAGTPVVVSPRGMLEDAALAHHAWRKRLSWAVLDARVMRGAACWHVTSTAEAGRLRERNAGARIALIPNPVESLMADDAARVSARAAVGMPASAPYVLFLGRLHPIKRLDLLAAAFAQVAAAAPDVHLVIAGPDESGHRATIEPLFAPARSRVRWCGAVDGAVKAGLLCGAAALVLCSDSESFGMSAAEALAAGVPVVVTRTCPWSAIEKMGCGRWVAQAAPDVADGLLSLLRDPDEARRCGDRGRDFAHREFSPSVVAPQWVALYAALATRSRSLDGLEC
jgi:glycosyltransferase involved in cell wall biosynthesis